MPEVNWPNLTQLANTYRSDKGTQHREGHAYSILYDLMFGLRGGDSLRIAEIGLQIGGPEMMASADRKTTDIPSIRMWLEYFPRACIYGLDICDFSEFAMDRFEFHRVDCGDRASLEKTAEAIPDLDIIIDDGSHASFHQQLTFACLFRRLRPRGFYVIEDTHWQPPQLEADLPPAILTRELFGGKSTNGIPVSNEVISTRADWADVKAFSGRSLRALRREYNSRHGLPAHPDDLPKPTLSVFNRLRSQRNPHSRVAPIDEAKLIVIQKRPD